MGYLQDLKYRNYGIVLTPVNIEFHKKNNFEWGIKLSLISSFRIHSH